MNLSHDEDEVCNCSSIDCGRRPSAQNIVHTPNKAHNIIHIARSTVQTSDFEHC